MAFRNAQDTDLDAIETLLKASNLPYEDCHQHLSQFFVYEENALIVGVGGAELYDDVALLRSIAIHSEHRGKGLGKTIFHRLKDSIQQQGINTLYLLTETANIYFKQLGFTQVSRDKVPQAIMNTEQFSSLCPASATVMTLSFQ